MVWFGGERQVAGESGSGGSGGRGEAGVMLTRYVRVSGCLRRDLAMRAAEMTLHVGGGGEGGGLPMRWNGEEMVLVVQSMAGLTEVRKGFPKMPSYP